jgi:tetratricopeptide (TPR) repeat protein
MEQPEDPRSYLNTLARAERAATVEAWDEAATLWARIVAANPVEGRNWTRLAEARYRAADYRGAAEAFEQALRLRDGFPAETAYRIACCAARVGETALAITWLERAWDLGYRHVDRARTDDELASLRDHARFRDLVAFTDMTTLSRDDGWRFDLRLLAREIRRRAYAPFRHSTEHQFDDAVAELHDAIPHLSDAQILTGMMKLLPPLGDGHAGIGLPNDREDLQRTIPLQFYLFEEGLFIIAAEQRYEALLGAQVLQFGERTVEEALAALDPLICRDNDQWPKHVAPSWLRELPILHALGVIPAPDEVVLTVRDDTGTMRIVRVTADSGMLNWQLDVARPAPEGWCFFPQTLTSPLPHYLRNMGKSYWFEYLRDEHLVYFQFNRVLDDPRESLASFCDRLFGFIEHHPVEKLVIDMRWNGGGNTELELPLFSHLIRSRKVNRRGALFVIIGRHTFSAAQNGVSFIDLHTDAIFVGEPTGSSPTFVGETAEFELPYCKARANVSDFLWVGTWPGDFRTWIAPTLYIPPTFAAYRANRDPVMEAILAWSEHLPGW